MAIEIIKAPAGAANGSTSEYASLILYFDEVMFVPTNTVFSFNTVYGGNINITVTGTNPTGYVDYDYVHTVIRPLFIAALGSNYNITVTLPDDNSLQQCNLNIVAKAKGPMFNITATNLPITIGEYPETNNTPFSAIYVQSTVLVSNTIYPVFTGNDYDFVFETDAYITNAGQKAVTLFNVSAKPVASQTLVMGNGLQSFSFTFTNTPSAAIAANNLLLSYTGSQTNQEQAQAIIEGLQRNYDIDNNYNLSISAFVAGVATIRIEGKSNNVPALLKTGGTVTGFAATGSTVNSQVVLYNANYRMFADLFVLQSGAYKKVLALDGVANDLQQVNFRDCQRQLETLIPLTTAPLSDNDIYELGNYIKWRIKACDYFGSPPTEKVYQYLPASGYYMALFGGAAQKNITDNFLVPYFIGSPLKLLTNMVNANCGIDTMQYLSAFVPIGNTSTVEVLIKVKLFYTDGTSSSDLPAITKTVSRETIVTAGVGYGQLDITTLKSSTKTVSYYEVWFATSTGAFTQKLKVKIDSGFYRNSRQFVFFNSFGQQEVLWVRGEQKTKVSYTTTEIDYLRTSRNEVDKVYHGHKANTNTTFEHEFNIASGSREKWELNYVKDFFASKKKFLVEGDKLIAIVTGNAKVDLGGDDDTLFTFEFDYSYAMEERGNA